MSHLYQKRYVFISETFNEKKNECESIQLLGISFKKDFERYVFHIYSVSL